jgi:hypothetical protein
MRAERGFEVDGPGAVASALAATEVGSMVVDMIAVVIDGIVRIKMLLLCLTVVLGRLEDIRATSSLQLYSGRISKPQLTVGKDKTEKNERRKEQEIREGKTCFTCKCLASLKWTKGCTISVGEIGFIYEIEAEILGS